ncbi:MAG TPA: cell division protein SepF [Acidimicrobiia bacterium]|nr:cell division protein SepF [Acidimicrobiia bacterium]HTC81095.1 cell division protein SepF [Acidimicrobiia bacterium]
MAAMWRRAMVYLGLVDEPEDDDGAGMASRAPDPGPNVRPLSRDEAPAPAARPSVVRTMPSASTAARVHVVEPRGFNDAQEVGDRLKANQPVILNLQGLDRDLQRRLIDFSSGLAYALGGSMSRVADQVFLLTPSNVEVSQEEKERLQARGLFRA